MQTREIFDARGLALESLYGCIALEPVTTSNGKLIASSVEGANETLTRYIWPRLEQGTAPIDMIFVDEGAYSLSRRRAWYPDYKSKKEQDKEDEVIQQQKEGLFAILRKIYLALGCTIVKTAYTEADDTIAYLAKGLQGKKLIWTVDNDLLQLSNKDTLVFVKRQYKSDYKGLSLKDYNFVALYKSICGDTSDGYTGVRGFGEKSFNTLLQSYNWDGLQELETIVSTGNFDRLREVIDQTGDKLLQKLYEQRNEWTVAYKLASLHPEWCETCYSDKVIRPQWSKRVPTLERLREALVPVGLGHWLDRLQPFVVKRWLMDAPALGKTSRPALNKMLNESRLIAFDYESYDSLKNAAYNEAKHGDYVDVLNQKLTGCSFAFGNNLQYCFYMPVKHRDTANCKVEDIKNIFNTTTNDKLVAHNAMFEMTLSKLNFEYDFPHLYDTYVMSNYVDENTQHGLKFLSKHWLNYDQITYSSVVKSGDMRDISGEEVLIYGCDDSIVTAHLAVLFRIIMECEGTWDFYEQNDIYFEKAMLDGFIKGVPIDFDKLNHLHQEDLQEYSRLEILLRNTLAEHCSTINLKGFEQLWHEVRVYDEAMLKEKGLVEEEVTKRLAEKKAKVLAACRYVPISAPEISTTRKDISLIAKALNLPALRSIKPNWINTYCTGITEQAAAGTPITAEQEKFVALLYDAVHDSDTATHLLSWMQRFVASHTELWEGDQLSVRSPKQMAELLYGKMALPILTRNFSSDCTPTKRDLFELEGAPSTSEGAIRTQMTRLKPADWQFVVLDCILKMRAINTRCSMYYIPYPLWKSPIDGRIHPQIKNYGTVTGRPSGSSPNILQVSKLKDEGKLRSVYLPQSKDECIISIDFNQQELAVLAGESGDENLISCYTGPASQRKDVHTITGHKIFKARNPSNADVSYETFARAAKDSSNELNNLPDAMQRPYDIRKLYAKRVNFLASYGGAANGLAAKLIVPTDVAEDFLDSFFAAYPKVKEYQERTARQALMRGFVSTCYGTRRHLLQAHDKNKGIAKGALRQAGNMPIQGGCANVLKIVLREYVTKNIAERTGATLIAPIYDELVLSCPKKTAYSLITELSNIMELTLPRIGITLETSVSIGNTWGEQTEIGRHPTEDQVNKVILQQKAA